MTASALLPAPHAALLSLTYDDATRAAHAGSGRSRIEDSVLDRVAHGEPGAALESIDQFGALVWSIACRLTPTRADAEDAVQEIFADVWRSAGHFDPEHGSERVFVAMIARRRLIDRMRHATYRDRTQFIHDIASMSWADPDHRMEVCVEARAAARAVMQLRPELRKVLELGLLQGLSHAKIAQVSQMPLGRVKSMMRRGLIQVREFMAAASARKPFEADA
jgi:RNA polymerase sigma-70 factor, ECF subfamily